MNRTKNEVNTYLDKVGWTGRKMYWPCNYEMKNWNSFDNNEDAYEWYKGRMNSLANSVEREFQAKHSAMSPQGASAYADNWN